MLNLDENETADLAWVRSSHFVIICQLTMIRWQITKYSISCYRRIVVVPPLQDLSKFGDGVSNSIYSRLIPSLVRCLIVTSIGLT